MITLLGTSNTLGGHDKNGTDPDIMLHNVLSRELNCHVLNLATPGRAVERYAQNLLYAYDKYHPSLVLCELFVERSYNNFWFPTHDTMSLIKENAEVIHQSFIEERFSWKEDRIDRRYIKSRVNRQGKNSNQLAEFKNCLFHIEDISKLLEHYNKSCVYLDDEHLCALRTIDSMFHLELLAKHLKVNILYFALFETALEFNKQFINTIPPERFINSFYGIPRGFDEAISDRCDGKYFSHDNDHFNEKAESILIKEYIAPYLKYYSKKNQIDL